ncbi:MAG TPA: hypothetical protein VGF79_00365 [Bacteroidia bacterium]
MSKRKKHIDELFKEGLKDLSLFVSDRDFNAIDGKSEVFNDDVKDSNKGLFTDFELEVGDADWLATKNKLEVEKAGIERDSVFQTNFNQFEIEPQAEDWPITYKKYLDAKRRRVAFWWMSTGVLLLSLALGLGMYHFKNKSESLNALPATQDNSIAKSESGSQTILEEVEVPSNNDLPENTQTNVEEIKTDNTEQLQKVSDVQKASKEIQKNSKFGSAKEGHQSEPLTEKESSNKFSTVQTENVKPELNTSIVTNSELLDSKDGITGGIGTDEEISEPIINKEVQKEIDEQTQTEEKPESNPENKQQVSSATENKPKDSTQQNKNEEKGGHQFYIGMVNQVDFTKSLLLNSNPERYNSIRKASDRWSTQYTFGFEFGKIGKKFILNAGLQATQINFSNRYNYSYRIYDSLPVYNTNGQIIGYFLSRARDTFMNSEEKVKITKVQLPLNLSFISKLNKNLDLIYGFGGVLSYNVSASGTKTLSPFNTQLYRYSAFASKERTFNVMPQLNCGVKLDIGKHWMLSGQVISSIYGFSRFKPEMTVSDHPYSLGLNIKLMYKLK